MKHKTKFFLKKLFVQEKVDILLVLLSSTLIASLTYKLSFAAFFAVTPLLYVIYRRSFKSTIIFSAFTGLTAALLAFDWAYDYETSLYINAIIVLTIFFIIFSAATHFLYHRIRLLPFLAAPIVWVWIMLVLDLTKYGGYVFEFSMFNPSMAPLIWVIGGRGITFLIIGLNSALAEFFVKKTKTSLVISVMLAITFMSCYAYSASAEAEGEPFKVILVQGNFEETWEWREDHVNEILATYKELSEDKKDTLIIWPEHTFPLDIVYYYTDIFKGIQSFVKNTGSYFIIGSLIYDDNSEYHYDSALLFSPEGTLLDVYNSYSPAFFNEYTLPGKEGAKLFKIKDKKAGIMVCAEETTSEAARTQSKQGAQFLISIANNQNFKRGIYPSSLYTRLRAAETRKYLVRAANTGITQIVDPYGRIVSIEENKRNILIGDVRLNEYKTFYTKYGDTPLYLITLLTLVLLKRGRK